MVIEKRQLLGREKRDINETCHITTAPEIESRALYTCESRSWGEKKRYQSDWKYKHSSWDEQVDTRLATYPRNLIIDTFSLPLPLLAPWCAQRLATLSYTFARSFSFNHFQAKSTCLKKRCKHRNSGRIPSLIGSLTPAHDRLSRNMMNNFCKRIISHLVTSQYLKYVPASQKLSPTRRKDQ